MSTNQGTALRANDGVGVMRPEFKIAIISWVIATLIQIFSIGMFLLGYQRL
jgi:hypothetical protein